MSQFCEEMFHGYRATELIVHDNTIRTWVRQKARELNMPLFAASHGWVQRFKSTYSIPSRRITRFVTHTHHSDFEVVENQAIELLFEDNVRIQFDPGEVFNTDRSGFSNLVRTSRTLSYSRERNTVALVNALGSRAHSYTIQPLLNMDGRLMGALYVNLRDTSDEFGPLVAASIPGFPNLHITCWKSGKLNKLLVRAWSNTIFEDVLRRLNSVRQRKSVIRQA